MKRMQDEIGADNKVQAVLSGATGTVVRVNGKDYYYQARRGSSWIDLFDNHHVGQRSLEFIKLLAVKKAGLVPMDASSFNSPNAEERGQALENQFHN